MVDNIKRPVHSFSKRKSTNDKEEAFSDGLDFVFSSTKTDKETLIANIESLFVSLFGYATDRETMKPNRKTKKRVTNSHPNNSSSPAKFEG